MILEISDIPTSKLLHMCLFCKLFLSSIFFFSLKEQLCLHKQEETTPCDLQVYLEFAVENCQVRGLKQIHKITVNMIL